MIAGLVNAGVALDEPVWIAMAARAFMFIAAKMTRGDRLGHSWREGRLLFPGLASDHAAMIRAALALHEATGEHGLSRARARLAGHARPPLRQSARTAAISSPPTTPRAWWCGRAPPPMTPRPNPNALAAQNLVRLAVFTGQHAWREQADRLFDGIVASAGENLFAHLALLNALDLRLRAAEIVVAGEGAGADALARRRAQAPVPRPHRAARTSATRCRPRIPRRRRSRPRRGRRRLRLRRRDLLAAGDEARRHRRSRRRRTS